ncbi:hypothetical protein AB0K35_28320 [Micromonospora sp. NPDC053740]|uniref:hypothetical protein n=1 Tax=Micromonospora sp. NPDC053740 TaxID=3155173 RepID=UPI003432178D
MADLTVADIIAARPALPYLDAEGFTVTRVDGHLYLNAHKISELAALDLSIVLAVAVQQHTNPNHATRTEANHG